MKYSRTQIVIKSELILPLKKILGRRLLESNDSLQISFSTVVNDLLEAKIKELQVKN